jgi:rubrerythrin
MSIQFNADEVLQVAEEIERNGATFYRRAAKKAPAGEGRDLLMRLAAMEEEHEQVFMGMRAGLSEAERKPVTFDPDSESALYLKVMASRHVFDMGSDPMRNLTGHESMEEVFEIGVQAEKDSIVFYLGLKELVPARLGKGRLDQIITEEMGHLGTLGEMLAELEG